jgi:hypothetical protein
METINGYYVDENNNRWNIDYYSIEEAKAASHSLTRCSDCSDCSYCSDCSRCLRCSRCSDCSGFKTNPNRYVGPTMGSRKSQTTTYWIGNNIQVVCGCFRGNLDEFEKRVKTIHTGTAYESQYMLYIKTLRVIFELESQLPEET